jgi:hypothetical protein
MLERIKKIKVGNPLDPETMIVLKFLKPNGKS